MIFLVYQKRGNKRQKKRGSGAGLTSPHSLPSFPPRALRAEAQVGEGQQNQNKKTKAACSNRLLPKGCHGNRGTRVLNVLGEQDLEGEGGRWYDDFGRVRQEQERGG